MEESIGPQRATPSSIAKIQAEINQMQTLQKNYSFKTKRGMYSPQAHRMSNEYGVILSDFLERKGFEIEYVVTNPERFGERPFYVGDDAVFDLVATKEDKKYCFELDIKTIKTWLVKRWKGDWPAQFPTVDFVKEKYERYKIAQKKNDIYIACICLNYVDKEGEINSISDRRFMWSITMNNLWKQPVRFKKNSRTANEQFYVVPIENLKWSNLNELSDK